MQSGYGGVSEIQQFMVDGGCPSSLFSISTAPPNAASPSAAAEIHQSQKFNPFPHPHHHHHHHQHPPPPHLQHHHTPAPASPHFAHFGHPNPITQQLFQQTHHHPHHHQFQLFHHQQQHLGLDQESGPENSNSPAGGGPSFLPAMNFTLGVNESSGGGGGSREGLNEDDGILQGDDGSESRLHHSWHREEESTANIKEPFWRPLDIDYINPNNKRPAKDKQPAEISSNVKHLKKSHNESAPDHHNQHSSNNNNTNTGTTDSNYKLFSELEAIYKPGGGPAGANNQTGSGASALTGDDNPLMPASAPWPTIEQHHQPDNISDTSNGGDAPPQPPQPLTNKSQKGKSKRSKRARQQKQLASIAGFFESLVKQLMDHQEELHRKFLEVMERRDQERTNREEAWRKQEAAKTNRESVARAQERDLAAAREAAIISFLEKITGESLNLPTKAQFQAQTQFTDESQQKEHHDDSVEPQNALEPYNADSANNNNIGAGGGGGIQLGSSRWPKAEVQALIRVRSGLETRFQEPGLKGPLWEEVSREMAGLGYQRSAKRCKEKWENINKYFRKTKDSGKKRPQHSKTCPYFHQLDQLYSKSALNAATVTPSSSNANMNEERKENSELLDAIVLSNEAGKRNAEFNEANNEEEEEGGDEGGGGDHGEEGQGESQEIQGQNSENVNRDHDHHQLQLCEMEQSAQRDSAHFFHRLRT